MSWKDKLNGGTSTEPTSDWKKQLSESSKIQSEVRQQRQPVIKPEEILEGSSESVLQKIRNKTINFVKSPTDHKINVLKNARESIGDFLKGRTKEFQKLQEKFEAPYTKALQELNIAKQNGQINDEQFNFQRDEILKQKHLAIQQDPEGKQYEKESESFRFNMLLNIAPMEGMASKISGKTKKLVAQIADNKESGVIAGLLKKLGHSDDVAKELSEKLVDVDDAQTIYKASQSGKVISEIEARTGKSLNDEGRRNVADLVESAVTVTKDEKEEAQKLKEIIDGAVTSTRQMDQTIDRPVIPTVNKNLEKEAIDKVLNTQKGLYSIPEKKQLFNKYIKPELNKIGEIADDEAIVFFKGDGNTGQFVNTDFDKIWHYNVDEFLNVKKVKKSILESTGNAEKDEVGYRLLGKDIDAKSMEAPKIEKPVYKPSPKEEALLDDIYKKQDEDKLKEYFNDFHNSEEAANVFQEMDVAKAGERIITKDLSEGGEFIGIKSSFPEWMPKELRSRKSFDNVQENLMNGTVPTAKKERAIYDEYIKEIAKRKGIKPEVALKAIESYEGLNKAKVPFNIKNLSKKAKESLSSAKKATGKLPTKEVKKVVRKNTGQVKKTIYRTTEEKALREKLRTASIYSKIGARNVIKTTRDLRKAVREYAKDLPISMRSRLLSQEQFAGIKSKKQLASLLDKVDMARTVVAIKREKQALRQEIGHLRKTAREKDTIGNVKMQARMELGIKNDTALKNASLAKLKRYKEIIKENLKSEPPKPKEVDWKNVEDVGSSKGKKLRTKIGEGVESAIGTISSNIRKYGGDKLFSLVREREFKINTLSKRATDKIEGFQKGLIKMKKKWFGGKEAFNELSYSLFNQNFDRAREIASKYRFEKELDKVIEVLDDIHLRANEAGLKVGKLKNYFPRIVKDYDGLFAAYNKKFGKEGRSFLDSLLTKEANKKSLKVSELTQEMKSDILTKALRGYGQGKINVGNVTRARKLKDLDPEFLQFYHTPQDALTMYVSSMNQRITLKELFDIGDVERDTIGSMVEKMNITPNEMARLKESLYAVLAPQGGENIILNKLRKSATLTLLSNIASTLFQIADIGVNAYKHGVGRAVVSLIRSKPIKRDELFTNIAHEFADSNMIKNSLKAVGFDRLDRLNSEAFMGNAFRQAIRQAKKGSKEIKEYADVVFRGKEDRIAQFMDDMKAGKVTDDVRLYVFNKILDVSPRTMSEMPEAYAKHPNARLFYSMKSYGIKILDVYRNDVARQWKKSPAKSVKNFVKLTAILTLAGATGSQIRDWYNGKDTKFSDNVMNNMLQIMLFSTYDAGNVQKDGLGRVLLSKALPPSRWIDDLSKDILTAGDGEGLKSVRNIPIIGNEIYNRVGKGKKTIEKNNAKNNTKNTSMKKGVIPKKQGVIKKPITKKPLPKK